MITELLLTAVFAIFDVIEALVPPIPWPSWLEAPLTWAESMSDSVSIKGVTAWIHPLVLDAIALALLLRLFSMFLARVRSVVSLISGGGGGGAV